MADVDRREGGRDQREYQHEAWSVAAVARFGWAVFSIFVVESFAFGLAVLGPYGFWAWHHTWPIEAGWARVLILAMAAIPAYLLFAMTFAGLSALAMRAFRWWPPERAEMRVAELEWPMLDWIRYTISLHLVRIFAGSFFRTTPLWVLYMRLNGARLGRRVWINSLDVTDHCLLDFGDDVVIGGGVHVSGHTVEGGIVKTAPVRLGSGVTVGVAANIEIGVVAGARCQIGALSVVPKYAVLDGDSTYVGIPARKLVRDRTRDAAP